MALALPTGDMLETPPGYPFEEINYEDIEVEEVCRLFVVAVVVSTCSESNVPPPSPLLMTTSGAIKYNVPIDDAFRLSDEERLGSCAKPSGKAMMWPSRPSRVNQRGKLLLWR